MNIRSSRQRTITGILVHCSIITILFLLSGMNNANAFYTWTDEKGQLHVTDYPKPQKPAPDESVGPDQEKKKTEPAISEQAAKPGQPPAAGEKSVVQSASSVTVAPVPGKIATVPSSITTTITQPAVSAVQTRPASPQAGPVQRGAQGQERAPHNAIALLAGLYSVLLILLALGYLYFSLCIFLIARKLNVAGAWMAWVPILQIFTLISCAHKPAWWFLLLLVPLVNFFISIYLWMCIAENLGREKWFALLMLVPVVNLIYMGVLAFSKRQTTG